MRDDIVAVLVGASEWPLYKDFKPSKAFLNSARTFKQYLLSGDGLNVNNKNILDLFDDERGVDQINKDVADFLKKAAADNKVENLIIYYTGHGAFMAVICLRIAANLHVR